MKWLVEIYLSASDKAASKIIFIRCIFLFCLILHIFDVKGSHREKKLMEQGDHVWLREYQGNIWKKFWTTRSVSKWPYISMYIMKRVATKTNSKDISYLKIISKDCLFQKYCSHLSTVGYLKLVTYNFSFDSCPLICLDFSWWHYLSYPGPFSRYCRGMLIILTITKRSKLRIGRPCCFYFCDWIQYYSGMEI